MGAISVVARHTFLGGRSLRHYLYFSLLLALIAGIKIWVLSRQRPDALANGDTELIAMLERATAFAPLTVTLPVLTVMMITGLGVISEEFKNKTIEMVLLRISSTQFLVGSWLGFIAFPTAAFASLVAVTLALATHYGVALPSPLWSALFGEYSRLVMLYTFSLCLGALFTNPMRYLIALYLVNSFALALDAMAGAGIMHHLARAILWILPARLKADLISQALQTSSLSEGDSLIMLVAGENLMYAGGLLLVTILLFRLREVMAR